MQVPNPTRDTKIITEAGLAVVSTIDGRLLFVELKGTDTFGAVVKIQVPVQKQGRFSPISAEYFFMCPILMTTR
jgi:hypothetical protein